MSDEVETDMKPDGRENFHLYPTPSVILPQSIDLTEFYPNIQNQQNLAGYSKEVYLQDALRMIVSIKSDEFSVFRDKLIETQRFPEKDHTNLEFYNRKVQEWNKAFAVALLLTTDCKRMFFNMNLVHLFEKIRETRKDIGMLDFLKIYAPLLQFNYPSNIDHQLDNFQTRIQHNGNAIPVWLLVVFCRIKFFDFKTKEALGAASYKQCKTIITSFGQRIRMTEEECKFITRLLMHETHIERGRSYHYLTFPVVNNLVVHVLDSDLTGIIPVLIEAYETWKMEYTFKLKRIRTMEMTEEIIDKMIKYARCLLKPYNGPDLAFTEKLTFEEVYQAMLQDTSPKHLTLMTDNISNSSSCVSSSGAP